MKWKKLSDNHYVDLDIIVFTEWRHFKIDDRLLGRALDFYTSTGKGFSIPEEEGITLLKYLDEVRREDDKTT